MSSTLIRIKEDLKKALDQHINAFEATHGATLTMSQMIKKLLDNYNDKPPAKPMPKIKARTKQQRKIVKLFHQGMTTSAIAKAEHISPSYCRKIVREEKLRLGLL